MRSRYGRAVRLLVLSVVLTLTVAGVVGTAAAAGDLNASNGTTYGSPTWEGVTGSVDLSDGRLYFGRTNDTHPYYGGWVIRTDRSGSVRWDRVLNRTGASRYVDGIRTAPGRALLLGEVDYENGTGSALLTTVDANGTIVRDRLISGNGTQEPLEIIATSDGGYLIVGTANTTQTRAYDLWAVKFHANHSVDWRTTFPKYGNQGVHDVVESPVTGQYLMGGWSYTNRTGTIDGWLIRVSPSGTPNRSSQLYNFRPEYNNIRNVAYDDGSLLLAGDTVPINGTYSYVWTGRLRGTGDLNASNDHFSFYQWYNVARGLNTSVEHTTYGLEPGPFGYALVGNALTYDAGGNVNTSHAWVMYFKPNGTELGRSVLEDYTGYLGIDSSGTRYSLYGYRATPGQGTDAWWMTANRSDLMDVYVREVGTSTLGRTSVWFFTPKWNETLYQEVAILFSPQLSLDNGSKYRLRITDHDTGATAIVTPTNDNETSITRLPMRELGAGSSVEFGSVSGNFTTSGVTNVSVALVDATSGTVVDETAVHRVVVEYQGTVWIEHTSSTIEFSVERGDFPASSSVQILVGPSNRSIGSPFQYVLNASYRPSHDTFNATLNRSRITNGSYEVSFSVTHSTPAIQNTSRVLDVQTNPGFTAQLNGTGQSVPPIAGARPRDPDADGLYEDVNGDGQFNLIDVSVLYSNRNSATVQNNPSAFDFNGDSQFNLIDVSVFYSQTTGP